MDTLNEIIGYCHSAVESIDPRCREALLRAILDSRKVFIYGSGRSGLIGQLFAVRLVQLGLDVHFVGEMTTPIIGKEDLTLLVSNTGRTSSVVQTATIARRIGSKVISVTGSPESELTANSDVSIVLDIPNTAETSAAAPLGTVFEDSALLFFEVMVSDIMKDTGNTEEDMRNRHAIWV